MTIVGEDHHMLGGRVRGGYAASANCIALAMACALSLALGGGVVVAVGRCCCGVVGNFGIGVVSDVSIAWRVTYPPQSSKPTARD